MVKCYLFLGMKISNSEFNPNSKKLNDNENTNIPVANEGLNNACIEIAITNRFKRIDAILKNPLLEVIAFTTPAIELNKNHPINKYINTAALSRDDPKIKIKATIINIAPSM